MSMRIRNETPHLVLREDNVGCVKANDARICYPGVSSCITLTGILANGMMGVHVTIATSLDEIQEALDYMRAQDEGCTQFYVVGALGRFKPANKAKFRNKRSIRSEIRNQFPQATVRFHDTSPKDVHILVETENGRTDFFLSPAKGHIVTGYQYPDIGDRSRIPASRFTKRLWWF